MWQHVLVSASSSLGNYVPSSEKAPEARPLFVLSQLDTNFFYYGILLHFIIGRIIGDLIPRTRNLQTKFRINRNRRLSILSFYQSDELVGRITVHRTSFQLIQRTRYCLSPDDLACRRYQRRQTCIHTHLGDQRHCFSNKSNCPNCFN